MRCDFDTEEERRKPVGGGKVAALEAKIGPSLLPPPARMVHS